MGACLPFSEKLNMWKIAVGFVIFAALALWVINKGGDSLDMSGEKHDVGGGSHATEAASAPVAAAPASAAMPAASAASN